MKLDHISIWSDRSDRILACLQEQFGMKVLSGFDRGGQVIARGVRFRNGPFLDIRQLGRVLPGFDRSFHRLFALEGSTDDVEVVARKKGWVTAVKRRSEVEHPSQEPYVSSVSFRQGQGLLSEFFTVEHGPDDPRFGPLYDTAQSPLSQVELSRVWLPVEDAIGAEMTMAALGAVPQGLVESQVAPMSGECFQLGSLQLVTCAPWGPDRSIRLDLKHSIGKGHLAEPVPGLTLVVNGGD